MARHLTDAEKMSDEKEMSHKVFANVDQSVDNDLSTTKNEPWHDRMSANFFQTRYNERKFREKKTSRLIFHAENKDPSSHANGLNRIASP